jgi:hypothetical protein
MITAQPAQPYQERNGNLPPQDWYPNSQNKQPNQQPNYISQQRQPVVGANSWQGPIVPDNSWQGPVVNDETWQVVPLGAGNSWQGPVAPSVQVVDDFYQPENVPAQAWNDYVSNDW